MQVLEYSKYKVARSRFELLSPGFFSLYRDPEPEIPSPTRIPWRLATRFGISSFFQVQDSTGLCSMRVWTSERRQIYVWSSIETGTYMPRSTCSIHASLAGYKINHKGQVFVFTASNLFPSLQGHILNLPSFAYKE